MQNNCDNWVEFTGASLDVVAILKLFAKIQKSEKEERYFMPDYITAANKMMSDVSIFDGIVSYCTHLQPNLQALQQFADNFKVNFTNRYCEPSIGLCGEAIYRNGYAENIVLDLEDMQALNYSYDLECFLCNEKEYEDDYDAMMDLLTAKIQNSKMQQQIIR